MRPLSESLNKQIIQLAPDYIVCDNAPNTWRELKANAYDSQGRIRIYGGSSDDTIYGCAEVNYAFRAWHDSLHLKHNLSFQPEDEFKLAAIHKDMIAGDYEKALIYADVAGQVEYWVKHRDYVPNQREYILNYLNK